MTNKHVKSYLTFCGFLSVYKFRVNTAITDFYCFKCTIIDIFLVKMVGSKSYPRHNDISKTRTGSCYNLQHILSLHRKFQYLTNYKVSNIIRYVFGIYAVFIPHPMSFFTMVFVAHKERTIVVLRITT